MLQRNALQSALRHTTKSSILPYIQSKAIRSTPRPFHTSPPLLKKKEKVPDHPGPTNFSDLDVLGNTPAPSTSVDVCMYDGFGLNSGITIANGDGALLVNGEAFRWRPWVVTGENKLVNSKGQFEIPGESLAMLDILWPRPGMPKLYLIPTR